MFQSGRPPKVVANQLGFLTNYANFIALWSTFEVMLEILIMRRLSIGPEEASIICCGRPIEAKLSVLKALLNREPKDATGAALITHARHIANRNLLIHSIFRVNRETGGMLLVRREVDKGYKISAKRFDHQKMDDHVAGFTEAYRRVMKHFGVTAADLDAYTEPLEASATIR